MGKRDFEPGFRCNVFDIVILISGILVAIVAVPFALWLANAIVWVVSHFFLFCNVFRISRPLELAWALVFVFLCAGTLTLSIPPWSITFVLSAAATVVVISLEVLKPSYHGVGWQWINPSLRQWWRSNVDAEKVARTTTEDGPD